MNTPAQNDVNVVANLKADHDRIAAHNDLPPSVTEKVVEARALAEIYYEAINVYPPSTNDPAGFRAIEAHVTALLEQARREARLDELESLDLKDGRLFKVKERIAALRKEQADE